MQGARRRRWCVLRTYSQAEASIDIYADETKSKFKGTITLDKAASPLLIVKNYDPKKKKAPKNAYFVLKIDGKRTFQFTADSFCELKEWTALTRQAIDNGEKNIRTYSTRLTSCMKSWSSNETAQ